MGVEELQHILKGMSYISETIPELREDIANVAPALQLSALDQLLYSNVNDLVTILDSMDTLHSHSSLSDSDLTKAYDFVATFLDLHLSKAKKADKETINFLSLKFRPLVIRLQASCIFPTFGFS